MPREIIVDWTTPSGAGKASVMYFLEATSVASQRNALNLFLQAVGQTLSNQISWRIRTVGKEMLAATGELQAAWTEPTEYSGVGAAIQEPLPDASQALVRWSSSQIVNGRFLQGRTFLPGVSTGGLDDGNLADPEHDIIQNAADGLIGSVTQFAIWHRPQLGAGGEAWAAETASVNTEFAVLRRRRG